MKGYGENSQPAATSDEYRKGYDKIFGKKEKVVIEYLAVGKMTIDRKVDIEGEVEISIEGAEDEAYQFIDKEDSIKIVNHLKAVFKL